MPDAHNEIEEAAGWALRLPARRDGGAELRGADGLGDLFQYAAVRSDERVLT
jgi:hypothetical protein